LQWHSAATGNVTTQSFLKSGGTGTTTQFVDLVDSDQSGIGITSQFGARLFDNEITNFGIVSNFISISPSSTSSHIGDITIDSIQPLPSPLTGQETAEVCAEPAVGVFGGANCVATAIGGPIAQTLPLPAAYTGPGGAFPVLAVDATGSLLSDVKIRDF